MKELPSKTLYWRKNIGGRGDEEGDVGSSWITWRKREDTGTRSHSIDSSLLKRPWTCRQTDCGMNEWMNEWTVCHTSSEIPFSDTTPHEVALHVFPLKVQYYFVLTSSQMSCLLTPGLRFMIFSSADLSTPSWVNSTFCFPCSPSTLTFLKYLRSNVPYGPCTVRVVRYITE